MTIPEAAQLVIQAGAMASGGEVFLLDMGEPVKIIELARRMIELSGLSVRDKDHPDGDIGIAVNGLRPGEKLYEELLIGGEPVPTANSRIYKANEYCIALDELEQSIDELEQSIMGDDIDNTLQVLMELVQDFVASSRVLTAEGVSCE